MSQLVTITGDSELDAALGQLMPTLQKKVIRQTTRKLAKIVADDAKQNAPSVSGTLARNIKVKSLPRSRSSQGHGIVALIPGGEAFYALFLEFGTKERRHKSGKGTGKIEKGHHAFLRPALYDNENRIRRMFPKMIWEGLSKAYSPTLRRVKGV